MSVLCTICPVQTVGCVTIVTLPYLQSYLPVIVSRDSEEYAPMVPTEVVAATSTEYSVLGAKPWSITLVAEVLTVVCSPLLVFNLYCTV